MSRPNIKVDETPAQALAWCTACPGFRELRATRELAEAAGVAHLERAHPDRVGNTPFDRARQYRAAGR